MNEVKLLTNLKKLSQLLKQYEGEFIVNTRRQLLFTSDITKIKSIIDEINVCAIHDEDGYILNFEDSFPGHTIFHYKWLNQNLSHKNILGNLVILDTSGNYAILKNGELKDTSDDIKFKNQISNVLAYYLLRNSLENETVNDHHNEIKKEFVFYSSAKGVIKIVYEPVAPHIDNIDYLVAANKLITIIAESHYKSYFVHSLFKIASEKPSVNLIDLIKSAGSIAEIIKRDYELVLKQFDFENFKDKLLKEKDKYFNSIREILNKVFSQLVGIPISISASAFATYKVESETTTLLFILIGFIFYIIIYIKIQIIYKNDINDLEIDFKKDFEIIKEKSGLAKSVIDSEGAKVTRKLSQTRSMINVLISGIIVLGGSFVLYLLNQIFLSAWGYNLYSLIEFFE